MESTNGLLPKPLQKLGNMFVADCDRTGKANAGNVDRVSGAINLRHPQVIRFALKPFNQNLVGVDQTGFGKLRG